MTDCYLFAGPSLWPIKESHKGLLDQVYLRPPIKRGDLVALHDMCVPASVAIVDGVFHQVPAVGHQEIRSLLRAGWRIWGLSSMGAIRAYELREHGMEGYGFVFDWFCQNTDFRDDEVALLHLPTPRTHR